MPLSRLPTAARAAQAAIAIESAIREGLYPRGSCLPPERELAIKLGLSRPALREAIRTLAERGLIQPKHGVGTVVVGEEHRPIGEAFGRALAGTNDAHAQVHEIRELLEVAIAKRAAANATPAQRQELKRLQQAYSDAGENRDHLASIDADFHRALAQATGNPLYETMLSALRWAIKAEQRSAMERLPATDVLRQHAAVIAAIEVNNPVAAAAAMEEHLNSVRVALG
jgi:GntR family transcriptional regulator, transcriptional repressor for pyruvate dehydrogenase complex